MRKPNKKLRRIFESLLKEDVPAQIPTNSQQFATAPQSDAFMNTSLDQNVDRYLVRYERESIPMQGTNAVQSVATENFKRYSLKKIFEQEEVEDEELDLGGDEDLDLGGDEDLDLDLGGDEDLDLDLGGDEGGGMDVGGFDFGSGGDEPSGGGGGTKPQAVMNMPQININEFARSVARLVSNYDSLLDPKSTIINRARLYIRNNYDERMAEELMQILEVAYQLTPAQATTSNVSQDTFPTPYAAGSYTGG